MLQYLEIGFSTALMPMNILIIVIGTILGIIFGALPGFSATMGIAVMIPVTYGMGTVEGLILLVSIYCGAMYGGSISAILLHTPGTPAAAATVLDGYEMTKKGQAHEALAEAAVASFWGGLLSVVVLFTLAPPIAKFSVKFGQIETFLLAIFGLTIIASLASKNMLKGLIAGALGLLIGTIGLDKLVGFERYTFGIPFFQTGLNLVPVLIGLFSISQVMIMVTDSKNAIVDVSAIKTVSRNRVHLKDLVRYPVTYLRSAVIGVVVGIIPGAGGNIASFMGYNEARRASKNPELFGTGYREGVAGPEAANNAVTGGSLIPMLTLGIPGNSVTAILLGGLMIKGLLPGNALFTTQANITYPFIAGMVISNICLLVVGLYCAKYFANVAKTPLNVLAPTIVMLCVMGAFAINNSIVDVYVMIVFGILGYFLRRYEFDVTPLVLGIILGPIGEGGLTRATQINRGLGAALMTMLTRPICLVLIAISIFSMLTPLLRERKERKAEREKAARVAG